MFLSQRRLAKMMFLWLRFFLLSVFLFFSLTQQGCGDQRLVIGDGGSGSGDEELAPDISYSSDVSAVVGVAITAAELVNTGGDIESCAISPDLNSDTGLDFDTVTCVISGTATEAQDETTYTVTASNAAGDASASVVVASTFPPAPATPTGLIATGVSATVISLDWDDIAGATSYTVKRYANNTDAGNDTNGTTLTCASVSVSACLSGDLNAETAYYFRVRASNAGGSSALAAVVSGSTTVAAPTTPTALAAVAISAVAIDLDWDDIAGATSYTVKRYADNTDAGNDANGITLSCTNASESACASTGLSAGTTYYYRVSATNAGGSSALAAA